MDARIKSAHDAEIGVAPSHHRFNFQTARARRACPLRATHDSSPVFLMSAPGRPSRKSNPSLPRGERSAGRRGGVRNPRWMAGETLRWDALRRRPLPSEEERRLPALHCGVSHDVRAALSERGPATPVSQLLAAGRIACERSPAIARVPGVRCSRPAAPHQPTAGFPRLADPMSSGHISAPSSPLLRLHGVP